MDFNNESYLFFSVVSDTDSYDENVYYLKLLFHFHDIEKDFLLSINSDEAEHINSMILEFRAFVLGLKGVDSNDKK